MKSKYTDLLRKELELLKNGAIVLMESYETCHAFATKENYDKNELIQLEALTARFSRLSDVIIQKIFRLIDELDLETPGTPRDRINRAEKKNLIDNANVFLQIRDLRNVIAHEYNPEALIPIYKQVLEFTPILIDCIERINSYCKKILEEVE